MWNFQQRHCRLVHNTSALIEKFSEENRLFQWYKPIKRRLETSTETATTTKTLVKMELDENPINLVVEVEPNDNKDIVDKGSIFPDTVN